MHVSQWLREAQTSLDEASITTARLDALVLLEDTVGKDRAWLLANQEFELSDEQVALLKVQLARRVEHEPLAYIRGKTEFYGREFGLSSAVLEPRPESETMIELLKALCHSRPDRESRQKKEFLDPRLHEDDMRIADVGTGSGALGITAKLELPKAQVELLEIDTPALEVARQNTQRHGLGLVCRQTDLLKGSPGNYDVLLCNLPYVPDDYAINRAATHEPDLALFGGPDGLDLYRTLFDQISELAHKPQYVLTESLPSQHAVLAAIAVEHGYHPARDEDFIQLFSCS
jgi:release factor glutamine methyltransferase